MPFSLIPFLLLAIPVLEIAVFVVIGGQIGVLWTLAMILITAVIGSVLLRIQGFQIVDRIRKETDAGRIPGRDLGHGAMVLVAGVLLLTPGFVTDTIGFLLFVPQFRSLLWRLVASQITIVRPGNTGQPNRDDGVVDLDPEEFTDLSESDTSDRDSPWRTEPTRLEDRDPHKAGRTQGMGRKG